MPRANSDRRLRDLCAQVHEDDSDPRLDRPERQERQERKVHRKDWQICAEVRRAGELALGMLHGGRLQERLSILSVTPAPDASRVRIVIAPRSPLSEDQFRRALGLLGGLAGSMRTELARSLARKRLPQLVVELLPGAPCELEEGGMEHD